MVLPLPTLLALRVVLRRLDGFCSLSTDGNPGNRPPKAGVVTRTSPAFGLLEVLISGGVLALIAGATVALATSSLRNSVYSANRTAALHLAQEGVEQVRQIRDTTFVDESPNSWSELFPAECRGTATGPASCALTPVNRPSVGGAGTVSSFQLKPGSDTIELATAAGTVSFTRQTELRPISWFTSDDVEPGSDLSTILSDPARVPALQVLSRVSWQEHSRTITVESSTFLTDWRQVQ